jgi:hypothetical protein
MWLKNTMEMMIGSVAFKFLVAKLCHPNQILSLKVRENKSRLSTSILYYPHASLLFCFFFYPFYPATYFA